MKFVFDLDGTLCFDRRTIDDEIMQVLLSAPKYGHDLVFATTRSYRDCLATLGPELSQKMVVGLNGGLVYEDGQLIFERAIDERAYQILVDWCQTYNLPFIVDESFDYSGQILEKMPFISRVDPLEKAQFLPLEAIKNPIKMVIYMGNHENLVEETLAQFANEKSLEVFYDEGEKCIYLNPAETHKAKTLVEHVGNDVVVFGNDRNDIELFKESLYAVQVGDFSVLTEFADEQIKLVGDYQSAIAAKILEVFALFRGK